MKRVRDSLHYLENLFIGIIVALLLPIVLIFVGIILTVALLGSALIIPLACLLGIDVREFVKIKK